MIDPRILSKTDRSRMMLFQMGSNNPQSIPSILNAIKELADEALKGTLDVAQKEAFVVLRRKIEAVEAQYEKRFQQIVDSIDAMLQKKVDAIQLPKGDQGDKGDSPTEEYLRELIQSIMPEVNDGKTPTADELVILMKPILLEIMTNDSILSSAMAEMNKQFNDQVYGKVMNMIAEEITKLKRVGGGYAGDRIKAGEGVEVTMNSIGQKVISIAGSGSVETPTGTVNGVNTAFVVTATPKWIVSDGVTYYEGAGYSIAGFNVTMDIPPSQFIRAIR